MCVHLSLKMDSSAKMSERLAGHTVSWWLLPLLSPSETDDLLCTCVQLGNPLDHKNEKNGVALSSAPVRALVLLVLPQSVSGRSGHSCSAWAPLPHSTWSAVGNSKAVAVYRFTEWGGWGTLVNERTCCWPQEKESRNDVLRTSFFLHWG